jgi:hypothetical protein
LSQRKTLQGSFLVEELIVHLFQSSAMTRTMRSA